MADLAVTNDFTANTTILSAEMNTNFTDIETYINNRNTGSTSWDNVKSVAAITIAATTNQLVLGTTNTVTLNSVAPSAARVYTLRDAGSDSDVALLIGGVTASVTELAINNTAADGDPVLSWELSGTNQFTMGVDDGDSDVLKIGTTAIGTGTMLQATAAGEITMPLQPSFLATAPVNTANVTGDGTDFTVEFDNEVYDQNADFNTTTFIFTAPVTGRYLFTCNMRCTGVTATHTGFVSFVTSNRSVQSDVSIIAGNATVAEAQATLIVDMDANDTSKVQIRFSADVKTVEIVDSSGLNWFSGQLIA